MKLGGYLLVREWRRMGLIRGRDDPWTREQSCFHDEMLYFLEGVAGQWYGGLEICFCCMELVVLDTIY